MAPVAERACTIPTAADADWSTAVKIAPARMPITGLSIEVSMPRNPGSLPRDPTDLLMLLMPNISTANPIMMSPMWRAQGFFTNMRMMIPETATAPVRVAVERMLPMPPLPI